MSSSSSASSLKKKFEQAAVDASKPVLREDEYSNSSTPLPPSRNDDGSVSSSGMKAKYNL